MVFVLFNLANRLIGKDSNRCLVQMSMKCTPERFFFFIRQCEKLGKCLESWIFRAVQKKAGILHNLWNVGKCAHQNSPESE